METNLLLFLVLMDGIPFSFNFLASLINGNW